MTSLSNDSPGSVKSSEPNPGTGVHPKHGHKRDEILEALWTMEEDELQTRADLAARVDSSRLDEIVAEMIAEGDVVREGDRLALSEKSRERALQIIRRHRLAERLFCDVFGLDEQSWEASACSFEHILDEKVTESVCAFLGHPPVCPHGKPVPPGRCCTDDRRPIEPLVTPLKDIKVGQSGRIVFITPRTRRVLSRLASYGVVPGTELTLKQRFPSYVIRVDQTDVALESAIAKEIFVRPNRD
jgi:DtxR family Mn-dependent transcriptional regulator